LVRLWRHTRTVQFGVDPSHAVVLEFGDFAEIRLLDLMDGTRTEPQIHQEAAQLGIPTSVTDRLLRLLRSAGLLFDPAAVIAHRLPEGKRRRLEPELAGLALRNRSLGAPASSDRTHDRSPASVLVNRHHSRVRVCGRGRMVAPVAALLAAAGVGRVELEIPGRAAIGDHAVGGLLPGDEGRSRLLAAQDAVLRAAPDTKVCAVGTERVDLVIFLGTPRPAPLAATTYALRRQPHLTAWLRDGTVVVGPLVEPGRTTCLQCVDLHRQDRDPAWPLLAAQLATTPERPEPGEVGVVTAGAALTVMQALYYLDGGEPETMGGTLELRGPGRIRRRSWTPHPRCRCLIRPRRHAC